MIFVPPLAWSPAVIYLLVATPIFGALIYGGLFAIAGGVQFFLIDGAEFTASFVYQGARTQGELPGSVLTIRFGWHSPSSHRRPSPHTPPPC